MGRLCEGAWGVGAGNKGALPSSLHVDVAPFRVAVATAEAL